VELSRISTFAAPLAAMAFGAMALAACGNDEDNKLAQNDYSVPSERDTSTYSAPSTTPSPDLPPSTIPPRPQDPDDPAPLPPVSPPPPLPN
jgi:hypothetical protein